MAVDNYKGLSSSKEMVKHGEVIYKTYLSPDAVSLLLYNNYKVKNR